MRNAPLIVLYAVAAIGIAGGLILIFTLGSAGVDYEQIERMAEGAEAIFGATPSIETIGIWESQMIADASSKRILGEYLVAAGFLALLFGLASDSIGRSLKR